MSLFPKPILMIGAHPYKVKGGVSGCVRNILSSDIIKEYRIEYIATMVDGSWFLKLAVAVQAFFIFWYKLLIFRSPLVHVHGSKDASFYRKMLFMYLARIWRKKIIFHCHSGKFDQFYYSGPGWQKSLIRWVLSLSDRIVVLSPHWTAFFSQIAPASRLRVLENAVPLAYYQQEGAKYSKSMVPTILFAGLLTENKGIMDLLSIVPQLVEKDPTIKVLLAGSGDFKRIRAFMRSSGIEESVQLLGWVDPEQLTILYHQSHLFVLPSYYEGLPMVMLEAMACGLPIVSTRVGGIPELIQEGENGILIEPGDRKALVEALSALLADPIRRGEMAGKNIQKIREQYDIPVYVEKLRSLYRELLGENQ